MKTQALLLQNFIRDFNLENQDGSECFTANLDYKTKSCHQRMNTEVHLITFKETGKSMLYFVDPAVLNNHLPTEVCYDEKNFQYSKNQYLTIRGISKHDELYTLLVHPLKKKCYQETVKASSESVTD